MGGIRMREAFCVSFNSRYPVPKRVYVDKCDAGRRPNILQACNSQACKQARLSASLKLAMDFESVVQSAALQFAFETTFRSEIAAALNISMDNIAIVSLSPGSVDVKFDIFIPDHNSEKNSGASSSPPGAMEKLKNELIEQVSSPTSTLNTRSTYARLSVGTISVEVQVIVDDETMIEDDGKIDTNVTNVETGNAGNLHVVLAATLPFVTILFVFGIYYSWKKKKKKAVKKVAPSLEEGTQREMQKVDPHPPSQIHASKTEGNINLSPPKMASPYD